MSFKRTRIESSGNFSLPESTANSSSQRTLASNDPTPQPLPNDFLRPSVFDQSVAAAATANALIPQADHTGGNQVRLGEFIEKCFFCKRSIFRDRNIFMYRSCAFCREECRDRQISIDDKKGKRQDQAIPDQTAAVLATPQGMMTKRRNIVLRSCAFCREECRNRHISIDDKKGKRQDQAIPDQTAAMLATPQGMMNNAEGGHAGGGLVSKAAIHACI